MNEQALFCDGTGSYVIPAEPEVNEKVKLRFRTGKHDVDEVRLYSKIGRYVMRKEKSLNNFKLYIPSTSYAYEMIDILLHN